MLKNSSVSLFSILLFFISLGFLTTYAPKVHATTDAFDTTCMNVNYHCYAPIGVYWISDASPGQVFPSEEAAAGMFFNNITQSSSYTQVCTDNKVGGCYEANLPDSAPYSALYATAMVIINGQTQASFYADIQAFYRCRGEDAWENSINAAGQYQPYCVSSNSKYATTNNSFTSTTPASTLFHKDGCATSCDPVDLYTFDLTDYQVDLQNHSPFPIIWSRRYVSDYATGQWIFNYHESLEAYVSGADPNTAILTLTRNDGQIVSLTGAKDDTGKWTWTVPPQTNGRALSPFLATINASSDLSSISIVNTKGETENYDATGKLISLYDIHGNHLDFTYDSLGRLTYILDSAGRHLSLNYPTDNDTTFEGFTGEYDSNGNPIYKEYTYSTTKDTYIENKMPTSVSDGTHTVSYTYLYTNGTFDFPILNTVTHEDGTVFTYNTGVDGAINTTVDETGNTYQTYDYSASHEVSSTALGNKQDYFDFHTNNGLTTPTGLIVQHLFNWNGQLTGLSDTSGNPIEEYVYLNSRPVASLRGTSDIYPVETDETMTPVRVLDASNNVVWSWENKEAFGLSAPTETMVNGSLFKFYLRFPGQYVDEETGLFQNGYRDYDPTTGRYMEVDPFGLMAGMNDYGYVGDNPVMNIDQSGLDTYLVNRQLSARGNAPLPKTDFVSHTFIFTTNPDGTINDTYSWGNSANLTGWNLDQKEDISAATEALRMNLAIRLGDSTLDPYIQRAFMRLGILEQSHDNGIFADNCKTESARLFNMATDLQKGMISPALGAFDEKIKLP